MRITGLTVQYCRSVSDNQDPGHHISSQKVTQLVFNISLVKSVGRQRQTVEGNSSRTELYLEIINSFKCTFGIVRRGQLTHLFPSVS